MGLFVILGVFAGPAYASALAGELAMMAGGARVLIPALARANKATIARLTQAEIRRLQTHGKNVADDVRELGRLAKEAAKPGKEGSAARTQLWADIQRALPGSLSIPKGDWKAAAAAAIGKFVWNLVKRKP
jgi:hypothetical protein